MDKIEKICLRIMACIGAALMIFLVWYSLCYTIRLHYNENISDNRDNPAMNLLFLTGVVVLVAIISRISRNLSERVLHICAGVCASIIAAAGCMLAFCADVYVVADQAQIYLAAEAIATGDTGWLTNYEYFYIFPYQFGMVEFYALLFKLTGVINCFVIGYAQAVATGVTVYIGFRITRELFHNKGAECIYLFCAVGFLPLYNYCIFIYGESFGICLLMLSIWFFILANRQENVKRKQILYFALSTLFMSLAYVARRGFLVIWVAMVIMQLLICMKRKKMLPFITVILMYLFMNLGQAVSIRIAENLIGREFDGACPTIMWVAMGFMDDTSEGKVRGPGSYNDFNRLTYIDCNYDEKMASGIARDYIVEKLKEWVHNPADMVSFFKKKVLMQWNEPTYGAFTMTCFMGAPAEWVDTLYTNEEVNSEVRNYLNHYQTVVYLALLGYFCLIIMGKLDERQSFPGLILLGGFCLSLLWESKSRYVYPYIVMILPCVANSLMFYTDRLAELLKKCGKRVRGRLQNTKE